MPERTDYAQTIDDAIARLEKSQQDSEPLYDISSEDPVSIDFEKATETEEIVQLIQGEEFMQALALNQDDNTQRIVKGLEATANAQHVVLDVMKGLIDEIRILNDRVEALSAEPQPRRAVLTQHEARTLHKSISVPNKDEGSGELTKSKALELLTKGMADGKCTGDDILKLDSGLGGGMSMRQFTVSDIMPKLSIGARQLLSQHESQ